MISKPGSILAACIVFLFAGTSYAEERMYTYKSKSGTIVQKYVPASKSSGSDYRFTVRSNDGKCDFSIVLTCHDERSGTYCLDENGNTGVEFADMDEGVYFSSGFYKQCKQLEKSEFKEVK